MKIPTRGSVTGYLHTSINLIYLALILGLAGCARDRDADPDASMEEPTAKGIDWYEGDMESAFALAKAQGKPLFLYWGAEWCPPCHVVKNKIFTRPEFVARMHDFVPVYLDGDTERAQILGEELEVRGYPTVIIFDPLGQEVMRMPSTVAVEQYETVLDSAIATMKPVKTVLDDVLASGPASARRTDLNLLAFYSWGQDSQVDLSPSQQVEAFERLYLETSLELEVERSRFLGLYLLSLDQLARESEESKISLSDEQRSELQKEVVGVLSDPRLRNANLLWIFYYADSIIDLIQPTESEGRQQLLDAWEQTADALEADASLSVGDQLSATRLKVGLASLESGDTEGYEVSPDLQEHVRAQAAWAMETVTDESELQFVVNTLAYLLDSAGLAAEAETMLLAKMNDTVAPYYFMSWIAGLKEDAGETEAALTWYRKAYDSAKGRYSRFRWGSTYLRRLMDLAPDSAERIEADSVEVLSELLSHEDAFAGGNHARLNGLESSYRRWNDDGKHEAELARIRGYVHDSCERFPGAGSDSQQTRCEAFLVPEQADGNSAL